MAATPQQRPFIVIGDRTESPFVIPNGLWTMYSKKGTQTVVVSIGTSASAIPDLELAETLGCPIHVVPVTAEETERWSKLKAVLQARSREGVEFDTDFAVGAEEKWVLPKNIKLQATMPWWTAGSVQVTHRGETATVSTTPFQEWTAQVCREMGLPKGDVRIDILKLDVPANLERSLLQALMDAGFRPGIILVRYGARPDTNTSSTLAAGHLQNCGYALAAKLDSAFLYYYTDQDLYMQVSWEDSTTPNPLVKDIVAGVQKTLSRAEGVGHARGVQHTDPPSGKTAVAPEDTQAADGTPGLQ